MSTSCSILSLHKGEIPSTRCEFLSLKDWIWKLSSSARLISSWEQPKFCFGRGPEWWNFEMGFLPLYFCFWRAERMYCMFSSTRNFKGEEGRGSSRISSGFRRGELSSIGAIFGGETGGSIDVEARKDSATSFYLALGSSLFLWSALARVGGHEIVDQIRCSSQRVFLLDSAPQLRAQWWHWECTCLHHHHHYVENLKEVEVNHQSLHLRVRTPRQVSKADFAS